MALTTSQQKLFSGYVQRWLLDQHAAGNDVAEYQFYKASVAQVKANLQAYIDADQATLAGRQTSATSIRAAQDAAWSAQASDATAITNAGAL